MARRWRGPTRTCSAQRSSWRPRATGRAPRWRAPAGASSAAWRPMPSPSRAPWRSSSWRCSKASATRSSGATRWRSWGGSATVRARRRWRPCKAGGAREGCEPLRSGCGGGGGCGAGAGGYGQRSHPGAAWKRDLKRLGGGLPKARRLPAALHAGGAREGADGDALRTSGRCMQSHMLSGHGLNVLVVDRSSSRCELRLQQALQVLPEGTG